MLFLSISTKSMKFTFVTLLVFSTTVNQNFTSKTIPDFFGDLPNLGGLFLGAYLSKSAIFWNCFIKLLAWLKINFPVSNTCTWSGGNQLSGTIPPNLATLRKLKMLWLRKYLIHNMYPNIHPLYDVMFVYIVVNEGWFADKHKFTVNLFTIEDNVLTGTIPTQLGNIRGLLQINFRKYTHSRLMMLSYRLI